jgi:CRP/FNR family cyclic AMP-dependent transcriptional regulator
VRLNRQDDVETFDDGDVIVREGERGREMYVIQSGSVEVTKLVDGQRVPLATLQRGAFFGEMSLLESLPRYATVRAKGKTTLIVLEPGSLLGLIRRDPTFAFEMLQQMSGRIRQLDDQLVTALAQLAEARAARGRAVAVRSAEASSAADTAR